MNFSIKLKVLSLFTALVMLSSCASIFAPRRQKVQITTPANSELKVNGEEPVKKKGKVVLDKYDTSTQLSLSKEGYKDAHKVAFRYKRSPIRFVSLVFFIFPFLYDQGPKSYKYEKELSIGDELIPYPKRVEGQKEIQLNKVALDVDADKIRYRGFRSYKHYARRNDKKETEAEDDNEKLDVENTIFTDAFNEILKNSGFVDTSKKALKTSYSNNLYLNATVESLDFTGVYGLSMVDLEIGIKWEVLDFYKETLFEIETKTKSGEFRKLDDDDVSDLIMDVTSDAMEVGLIEFLNNEEVKALLNDKSILEEEENMEEFTIPRSTKYVSSITESIESGVTIKNKDGHGSGFFISDRGHIITNYHVVGNKKDLKVVTNDNKEYDVEIVRVSKVNDLALLKIKGSGFLPFNVSKSEEIKIGQEIYALGTPSNANLSQSVSKGIISGVRDTEFGTKLIQTDVSINSGNSGGAMLSKEGVVLGIVSSKLFGFGVEGVAFGIPAYEIEQKLKLKF